MAHWVEQMLRWLHWLADTVVPGRDGHDSSGSARLLRHRSAAH
jgi:hypothetical protein